MTNLSSQAITGFKIRIMQRMYKKIIAYNAFSSQTTIIPIMKTCSAATTVTDAQQKNHQSKVKYSHSEANTIDSNTANQAIAILTHLQSNTCLIKCWNLHHSKQRD